MRKKRSDKNKGLGIRASWESFMSSLHSIRRNPENLIFAMLLDMLFFFIFYALHWFIYAPRIYNILGQMMETGAAAGSMDVAAMVAFDSLVGRLIIVLIFYLLAVYLIWSLIQGYAWKISRRISEKSDISCLDHLARFALVSLIFLIPITIIVSITAKMSFGVLPFMQMVILGAGGILCLILLHFMFISYAALSDKNGILKDAFSAIKDSLYLGTRYVFGFVIIYVLSAIIFFAVDIILRLLHMIHVTLYLAIGVIIIFPVLTVLRVSMLGIVRKIR
jgi:hypothetical protein